MTTIVSKAPDAPSVFASRQQVTAALQRAAERARVIAEQTGTQLVVASPCAKTPVTPSQLVLKPTGSIK